MNEYFVEALLTNAEQIGFSTLAFLLGLIVLSMFVFLISFLRVSTAQQNTLSQDRREERQQMVDMLNRAMQAVQDNAETNRRLEIAFSTASQASEQTANALNALSQTFEKLSSSIQTIQASSQLQQQTLLQLAEGRPELFVIVDHAMTVVAISDRACQLLGCEYDLVGTPFSWRRLNLLSYDGRAVSDNFLVSDVISNKTAYYNHIFLHISSEHPRQWFRVHVEPYVFDNDVGAIVIIRMTARMKFV